MNIVIYDNQKELNDYIRHNFVKALGCGREGACFLMPDGSVIKTIDRTYYYVEWLKKFEDIKIPGFIFANGGALVDNYVKALFQDYAKGELIEKIDFEKVDIEILKKALIALKDNISKLSEKGIKITDIFHRNILFDNNSFCLIDTQGYEFSNYFDLYDENISGVMREVYKYVFTRYPLIHRFIEYSNCGKYLSSYDLLCNPEHMIEETQEYFRKKYSEDLTTLDDINRVLKRI